MRKEISRATKALLRSGRVSVQIGILSVMTTTGVVFSRLCRISIFIECAGLDVLVQSVVFGKRFENAKGCFVCPVVSKGMPYV